VKGLKLRDFGLEQKTKPMKQIATFNKVEEAEMLRAFLESEGVMASVRDANTITADWMLSIAIGGVKVDVAESDFERALELMAKINPVPLATSPSPVPAQTRAPRRLMRYVKIAAAFTAALLLFLAFTVGFQGDVRPEILVVSSAGIGVCLAVICAMYDL
jgi:hypothetical protein